MHRNIEGPVLFKSEVELALKKLNRHNAVEPDRIVIGMMVAGDDFGIGKTTNIIN